MKSNLTKLLLLSTLCLTAFGARAIVLFQDNFSYPTAGPIVTEAAPNWITPPTDAATVGTTPDISVNGSGGVFIAGTNTATGDQPWALFTNGLPAYSFVLPVSGWTLNPYPAGGTIYYFVTNTPVAAVYASFTINVNGPVTNTSYFAYFLSTNFTYAPRIFTTLTNATAGSYRVSLANGSSPATPTNGLVVPMDLTYGQTYTLVVRYNLTTGTSTMWVNPANETTATDFINLATNLSPATLRSTTISDTAGVIATNTSGVCGFGLRNFGGCGGITVGSLIVGTTFADVLPTSDNSNPPFVTVPPLSQTTYAGDTVTLSVVAGGDLDTITYLWLTNGVPIADGPNPDGSSFSGSTSNVLTINNVGSAEALTYSVAITNTAGGTVSGGGALTVLTSQPTLAFTSQPTNLTITVGASATFSASTTDGGLPVSYQWYFAGNPVPGETTPTFTIANNPLGTNLIAVQVSDQFTSITSTNATLKVVPPAAVPATISFLRSLLNNTNFNTNGLSTNYVVIGTVTTWTNLTTPSSSEFYIEDTNNAGIAVFWSGAPSSTNLPPAGAKVSVTGPLSDFDGLLELQPTFGNAFEPVTILSTNNPLPAPLPLPFDPNLNGNPTNMQRYVVGAYCVASNVFLDLASGPTFGNNANEPLTNGYLANQIYAYNFLKPTNTLKGTNFTVTATNQNGQTFIIFYNDHTDILGKTKPTGPVTIYGVMGIFASATPYTSGYEFTPSRLADIVPALFFTNVLSNPGNLANSLTNTFADNVLYPGESITISVVAADPGGGSATLTAGANPPPGSSWTINNAGSGTSTATFVLTAPSTPLGTNYVVTLGSSYSSSGVASVNTWNIYVPTSDEQLVHITEVFANPTTNPASPAYNPLQRTVPDTNNVAVNDQYVEIANVSPDTVSVNNWRLVDASGNILHKFINSEALPTGTAGVVYGGVNPSGSDPNPPQLTTPSLAFSPEPADGIAITGLGLSPAGGVLNLYNNLGYLVDRVVYGSSPPAPANVSAPGYAAAGVSSWSRFPGFYSALVPQSYISTNFVTPGAQYDGGSWSSPTKTPMGVTVGSITAYKPVTLTFGASTSQASTLWVGNSLTNWFYPVFGLQFTTSSGVFQITNVPSTYQFYYITTQ